MVYQLIDADRGVFLLELPAPDGQQRAVARMAGVMALRHARSRTVLLLGAPQPRLYLRNAAGPLIPCRSCDEWFHQQNQEELCTACQPGRAPARSAPRKRRRKRPNPGQLVLPLFGPDHLQLALPGELYEQLGLPRPDDLKAA
jgi:hypothetical protein